MKRIILSACLALAASLGAIAQGPEPAASTSVARYLFGINPGQPVQVSSVDGATGLTRPAGLVSPSASADGLTVHPNGRFIYFSAGTEVLAYTIEANGTLKVIRGSPFAAPGATNLSAIAVSPSGKFLIAADYNLNAVWSYALNATTGALVLASGAPSPTGNTPLYLAFDATSAFAYVSCEGTGISAFSIDQTGGSLTAVAGSPFALSKKNSVAAGVTLDGSGNYLYVEGQIGVDGYKINHTTGALKLIAKSPFENGNDGGAMATDPLGKFIYGQGGAGTSVYTVTPSTGALTQLATSSSVAGIVPDPTGNYLYGGSVAQINRSTGALTVLAHSEGSLAYALSTGSSNVQYIPKFAYVANSTDNTISVYSIDPASGLLTPVETFKTGKSPVYVTTDIEGRYLYVANSASNTLSAFRISQKTGSLAQIKGSPYTTDLGPLAIAVNPSGGAVYVATDAQTVDSFVVASSGQLTNAGSTWYGTDCPMPDSLALDPLGGYLYSSCQGAVSAAAVGPPLTIQGTIELPVAARSLVMYPAGTSVYLTTSGQIDQIPVSGFDLQGPNYIAFGDNTLTGGLALDPLGRFLYAMEGDANVVQAETIAENGSMSEISGSPFTTGNHPAAAAVDFSGEFLYVVNQNDNNISGYSIDQTTGALTPLSPTTFATGKGAASIVVTGILQ